MSSTQRTLSLRDLAKEYAAGRIDRQTYKLRRSRLLDELAAYTPSAQQQQAIDSAQTESLRQQIHTAPPKHNRLILWLLVISLVLLLAGSLTYMLTANRNSTAVQELSSSEEDPKSA